MPFIAQFAALLLTLPLTLPLPALAQSASPAPDAPNSPTAVPSQEQPAQPPRVLIQTQPTAHPPAQERAALPTKPAAPTPIVNRRLILTDGSFQIVRGYQIVGDRVRYFSADREDWEELPASLVDWKATHQWEQNHTASTGTNEHANEQEAGMQEAAALDRDEAARRAALNEQMPEVVPGLRLPDRDGVFALDHFDGHPELLELAAVSDALNSSAKSRLLHAVAPLAGQRNQIEIDGAAASIRLHDTQPQLYLSLDDHAANVQAPENAITVPTHNAPAAQNNPPGAASAKAGFAIVRVDQRREMRILGNVRVSASGKVTQSEDVQPVNVTILPGQQWMRLTPSAPLLPGEYALVQILSPTDISDEVWDFSIHPHAPENPGGMVPIAKGK